MAQIRPTQGCETARPPDRPVPLRAARSIAIWVLSLGGALQRCSSSESSPQSQADQARPARPLLLSLLRVCPQSSLEWTQLKKRRVTQCRQSVSCCVPPRRDPDDVPSYCSSSATRVCGPMQGRIEIIDPNKWEPRPPFADIGMKANCASKARL